MNSIETSGCAIHFNNACYEHINQFLTTTTPSKIFVLVDENTHLHCLPYFLGQIGTSLPIEIIEIDAGEQHKNIETCLGVWEALTELGADKKSLMINLGGGVITDIGGFIASTYKRGIPYINVPTSLLAMVDASVGGKTGVDLGGLKNQIGVINSGAMVLVDTAFLSTLPEAQMRSGLAEMLKHGLIQDASHWQVFEALEEITKSDFDTHIRQSILIKKAVVDEDPYEKGLRKILNFGHTIGHAIETHALNHPDKPELLHGEAIAIGMVVEAYISQQELGLDQAVVKEIKERIVKIFGHPKIDQNDFNAIIALLKHDKKNEHGQINFVLLQAIGKPQIDCHAGTELIINALNFYNA